MSRLTVYRNPTRSEWRHTPYLLDVQTDFIESLATRVVVPLRVRDGFPTPLDVLNPIFEIAELAIERFWFGASIGCNSLKPSVLAFAAVFAFFAVRRPFSFFGALSDPASNGESVDGRNSET